MTSTESPLRPLSAPAMTAEDDAELLVETRPVRVSGYLALIPGLLSFFAIFAKPLILFPVLAVLTALFALRPYRGLRPAGYIPAIIALCSALLFGGWGVTQQRLKEQELADQGVRFAGAWLELLARGETELAVELYTHPSARQPASMQLAEYYRTNENARQVMDDFREHEHAEDLINAGGNVRWRPQEKRFVYTSFGRQMVATVWDDLAGTIRVPLQIELEYIPATETDPPQWKIERFGQYIEPSN